MDASILRVDKVTARVGCAATEVRHARWVTVHDGNHSVIGLIHVYAKGDLTRTAIIVYVTNAVVVRTRGASEVSNYATKTSVSNQHEVIGRTSLLKDACDDVVEGFFTELRRCSFSSRVDACSRSAEASRNVRRASRVKPVTKATKGVCSACAVFYSTIISRSKGCFDVALKFTDALSFGLCNLGRANTVNSFLQVRNLEVATELLNVVAQTSTTSELVCECSNVGPFSNTRGYWSSKGINSPLNKRCVGFLLVKRGKDRSFFRSEDGQNICQVLTIGNSRTWISGIICI